MELKVVKFGGSSLADAAQMKKVRDIITSDKTRRYVIPSAPGKRFDGDDKVTDLLYRTHKLFTAGENYSTVFNKIKARFTSIIEDLKLDINFDEEFEIIEKDLKDGASAAYMASRGEYLNGKILAVYLDMPFIDAKNCVLFDANGNLKAEKTNDLMKQHLKGNQYAVIPGFYGANANGEIVTFSRGGSDITGSIVARSAAATLYENWTDVSGFLMADPRCIDNPRGIDVITYKELRELSYMGATVLHDEAIFPVRYVGIPINIKNTNRPEDKGTLIVPNASDIIPDTVITGVAGKSGFVSISIEKERLNNEIGLTRRIMDVFEKHELSIEHMPTGIDTLSVIINSHDFKKKRAEVVADIYRAVDPDALVLDEHLALIAVVGRGMVRAKGTAARVFAALAKADINIKMIDQGSSELNIIVGVEEKDFNKAIRAIYEEFVC